MNKEEDHSLALLLKTIVSTHSAHISSAKLNSRGNKFRRSTLSRSRSSTPTASVSAQLKDPTQLHSRLQSRVIRKFLRHRQSKFNKTPTQSLAATWSRILNNQSPHRIKLNLIHPPPKRASMHSSRTRSSKRLQRWCKLLRTQLRFKDSRRPMPHLKSRTTKTSHSRPCPRTCPSWRIDAVSLSLRSIYVGIQQSYEQTLSIASVEDNPKVSLKKCIK